MADSLKEPQVETQEANETAFLPSLGQSNYQDSMAIMDREYEFFVTTNEPHQPQGTERGLIRRLVMRNFFETKGAGPQNNTSEHSSASTVMAKKQLKNRFRLSKVGQETPETKSMRRDSKEEPGMAKRKSHKAKRTVSGTTNTSRIMEGGKSLVSSPKALSMDEEDESTGKREGKRLDQKILLKINPSAHRFDPFDVLPVPGTPQLDMLIKLCKSSL